MRIYDFFGGIAPWCLSSLRVVSSVWNRTNNSFRGNGSLLHDVTLLHGVTFVWRHLCTALLLHTAPALVTRKVRTKSQDKQNKTLWCTLRGCVLNAGVYLMLVRALCKIDAVHMWPCVQKIPHAKVSLTQTCDNIRMIFDNSFTS